MNINFDNRHVFRYSVFPVDTVKSTSAEEPIFFNNLMN